MMPEQRKLCRELVITPSGEGRISKEEFLRQFPSALEDGRLALRWLDDANTARNADDLGCALIIGFTFGFGPAHKDILRRLVDADWHYSHEDIVSALQTWDH